MKTKSTRQRDDYFQLVKTFPLCAIRNDADHQAAVRMLRKLLVEASRKPTTGEEDYIDALTILVQEYEAKSHKIDYGTKSPMAILKHLMEERGMNVNDLANVIGSQPNASLILSGKRNLSKASIRKLAEYFTVSPALFL
jgi:HTH-type transcriptional regulator / antitoxin HigA